MEKTNSSLHSDTAKKDKLRGKRRNKNAEKQTTPFTFAGTFSRRCFKRLLPPLRKAPPASPSAASGSGALVKRLLLRLIDAKENEGIKKAGHNPLLSSLELLLHVCGFFRRPRLSRRLSWLFLFLHPFRKPCFRIINFLAPANVDRRGHHDDEQNVQNQANGLFQLGQIRHRQLFLLFGIFRRRFIRSKTRKVMRPAAHKRIVFFS